MSTAVAGVCSYCCCTEESPCRLADGETCWWLSQARTCCTKPDCVTRYYDDRREWERRNRPKHLGSAEIHTLIRRKKRPLKRPLKRKVS